MRKKKSIEAIYPLSPMQEGMLFHTISAPRSGFYFQQFLCTIKGSLDIGAFKLAWQRVMERHAVLRTCFLWERDGGPLQIALEGVDLPWDEHDWSGLSAHEQQAREDDFLRRDRERGFDLSNGPLMRLTLFKLSERTYRLAWTFHHILLDGWSLSLVEAEVFAFYESFSKGEDLSPDQPRPYKDYIAWLQQQDLSEAREFWRGALEGFATPTMLAADRPHERAADQIAESDSARTRLSEETTAALRSLSHQFGLTLNTLAQGAWAMLLSIYCGETDVVFGATASGRPGQLAGVESMIGLFINTLPVRVRVSSERPVVSWLKQLQAEQLEARQYEYSPLTQAQACSEVPRGTPLFDSLLVFENFPVDRSLRERVGTGLGLEIIDTHVQERINYPITVDVRSGSEMSLKLMYDPRRFDADSIHRMMGHFRTLLEEMALDPYRPLSALQMLTEAERYRLIYEWNDTKSDSPNDQCLHHLFEARVDLTPHAVAVVYRDDHLTYSQLNRRANQIAHRLRRLGVGPEAKAGLCLERSINMVAGLMGILKAGGAYVPLDPAYPKPRLAFMLEDSQVRVLLSEGRLLGNLPDHESDIFCLDERCEDLDLESEENIESGVTTDNLAYVIYTSGSTGTPKGVLVEHSGGCNLAHAQVRAFDVRPESRVLQFATINFDASVSEIFVTLSAGATLCLDRQESLMPGPALIQLLREQQITTATFPPSVLSVLPKAELAGLPTIIVAGESCSADLASSWSAGRRFLNAYGPTEASVCATIGEYDDYGSKPAIGRPITNTQTYLVDYDLRPVPVGVPGEVIIGGVGLARGYLNRPDLTAERFVPNPFGSEPGGRTYRTGDLARYFVDGRIEFLGRLDHQVKVRGFRIEPGEIEAALGQHPDVSEAVVVASEKADEDKRLVAYVVAKNQTGVSISGLRRFLSERLPQYLLPSAILLMDALPLSPNGKIDRRALPAPEQARALSEAAYLSPRTGVEREVASLWQEVLQIERVGIHDNFFDLGGNSLLMVRVYNKLRERFDKPITILDLFRHTTVASLARYLDGDSSASIPPREHAGRADFFGPSGRRGEREVAIIGMAGRFPGANNTDEFWKNLRDGIESIRIFTDDELREAGVEEAALNDPNYVKARAVLEGAETFDAGFFGFTPREAQVLDPQHRLFLECAWAALESAGYDPQRYEGLIGVYAGVGLNRYLLANLCFNREVMESISGFQLAMANEKDFLPTRVSYKLNLRGPSVSVQTACSTSLVAVHLACRSLLDGECDMALAGGASIGISQNAGYHYQEGGIWSSDGHCRAFDAKADGTVCGSGAGIVVLKRLADALADGDNILAVIKGSAINNDGSHKVGYTAPSIDGQARVIADALAIAGVEPETVRYIEAHGTGTELGDPVEIAALTQAFRARTKKSRFCAIGTVKTNIGHLDAAAGAAGLIKTTLALRHKMIPPSLYFEEPNPQIDFDDSPFYVATELAGWEANGNRRRAGVSSFGMGGTNAHVILEEAPDREPSGPSRPWQLLALSARSQSALETATANLSDFLKRDPEYDLADVAYTLLVGRRPFNCRRIVVCQSLREAVESLERLDPRRVLTHTEEPIDRSVVFMFPGGGAQYVNMGLELYRTEPLFRETIDQCSQLLRSELGYDLREYLYPAEQREEEARQRMKQTSLALPALFSVEYAMARLLMSWGVQPQAMIGHSLGEYAAACLAEVFTLEEALALVALRGRLFEELPCGAMLSVPLAEDELRSVIGENLSLAAINGPSQCVLSGPTGAIDRLAQELTDREVEVRRLHIDVAAHSQMVEPILERFGEFIKRLHLQAPRIPFMSNLSGEWITPAEATDWSYWVRHLRNTVRFGDGVAELMKDADRVLLEVGPGQTLKTLAGLQASGARRVISSMRHPHHAQSDVSCLLTSLGQLWLVGARVDWSGFYAGQNRRRLPLPTYPFERQRHWVAPIDKGIAPKVRPGSAFKKSNVADWFYIPSWERSMPPHLAQSPGDSDRTGCWLVFADERGIGTDLAERLERDGQDVVIVRAGREFDQTSDRACVIDPHRGDDYLNLVNGLRERGKSVKKVVHLWSVSCYDPALSPIELFDKAQDSGFYSLLFLAQALDDQPGTAPLEISVISTDLHDVTGEEAICPEKATLLGLCKVIPQECPGIACRNIDVVIPEPGTSRHGLLIAQLFAELTAKPSEPVVAYRGQHRWVQTFKAVQLNGAGPGVTRLREGGVYLITGGMGGIGLMIAECLARAARAKLILMTRSRFPDRDEWADRLATCDEQDPIGRKIRRLQSFEELGAEVFVANADVGDETRVRESLAEACDRFGEINGVIHAAGTRSLKTIHEISRLECEEQFRPKVHGLYALEKAFEGRSLDFGLIVSSLSSVLGIMGLAAYPAAHTFMDAFAYRHNRTGPIPWMAVDWDNWLTRREHVPGATLIEDELYMTADEGVEVFQKVMMAEPFTHLLISTGDLQARIDQWVNQRFLQEERHSEKARPASLQERPALRTGYAVARTETERILVEIWEQILGIDRVGIDDNYFDLGGDSVLAIHLIARARKAGLRLTPKQLFQHQTIAELAIVAGASPTAQIEPVVSSGPTPLTPIQRWFFEQNHPEPHHWNLAMLLEVREELDLALLQKIMHCLLENHDALSLRFCFQESEWRQISAPTCEQEFTSEIDLSALPDAEQRSAIEAEAARLQTSLSLSDGPLLRVALFDLGPEKAKRLLIIVHHLLVDIISLQILLEDFQTAYRRLRAGEPVQLTAGTTTFRDWARGLSEHARSHDLQSEQDYWLTQPWERVNALPLDYPEGINDESSACSVSVSLDDEETRALLREIPQSYKTQINDLLLTAMTQAFSRWTGAPSLLVNLEGHGREEIIEGVELWRTLGWFTTLFPVLLDLEGISRPVDALKAVKEQLRVIPNKGIGYGLLRYLSEGSEIVRRLQSIPQPQVAFLYMGQFDQALSGSSLFAAAKESAGASRSPVGMRQHLLDVSSYVFQDRLRIDLTYSRNIHRRSTIENLAQDFVEALRGIITDCQAAQSTHHTPSDFPGARLSQEQLDRVIASIGRLRPGYLKSE